MSFLNLDLNLLRVFDAVMSEQNLSRAATRLAMTQPAVSNAVKRLREAIGNELFIRTAYGVRSTPRAAELWPPVRQALEILQDAIAPNDFDPSTAQATFRVASADSTAALLLPSLVDAIESTTPGIRIQMVPLTTREPRPMLMATEIDLAVGSFPGVLAQLAVPGTLAVNIRYYRLYSGKFVCVMRRDHPLAKGELSLDDYCAAHHLQVSFSGRSHSFVDDALATMDRRREIILTVNQYFTAGRIISGSDLLMILPYHLIAATGMQDLLTWKELPFSLPEMHVDMLWHERNTRNPAHQWLRERIIAAVEESRDGGMGLLEAEQHA
jgi:DNA-binding transcriptional LysR family regulator